MHRGKPTVTMLALLLCGLAGPGCERIPQICEDSCKQQARCNPYFSDYVYSIRDCRSDCEDSLEDQVRDVDDDCEAAYLDYYDCVANLSCTELDEHDYSACDQESLRMSQRCEDQL
jgi:hypothetical protein